VAARPVVLDTYKSLHLLHWKTTVSVAPEGLHLLGVGGDPPCSGLILEGNPAGSIPHPLRGSRRSMRLAQYFENICERDSYSDAADPAGNNI